MFWKKEKQPDLVFGDVSERGIYQTLCVERAEDVPFASERFQKEKYGAKKFHLCPGMSDYAKAGYIVPAWCDIEFIANSAGVRAHRGETESGNRKVKFGNEPFEMGTDIPDGFVDIDPNIQFKVFKFDSPWKIFCSKSISALILPPIYHATWCNDLHFWPGLIAYDKFTIANVMLTPKKQGRITIRAGEPLIHIVPMTNTYINAAVGPATQEQLHFSKGQIYGTDTQFYRKYLNVKRFFGLEKG